MLNEVISLDEPLEMLSLSDQPYVDVESGEFIVTVVSNFLGEGKTLKKLRDGSEGYVKYINLNCLCSDLKTRQQLGRIDFKIFINTKGAFLASQMAALCDCYDANTKHSNLQPEEEVFDNGRTSWRIPALNGKSFVVGLVKTGTYTNSKNVEVPQYAPAALLSTDGYSACHYIKGVNDPAVRKADYEKFTAALSAQIKYQKDAEKRALTAATGGISPVEIDNPYVGAPQPAQGSTDLSPNKTSIQDVPF